jgi:hypothetical protein
MPEVQSVRPPSTPPGAQATHWTAPGPEPVDQSVPE